MTEEIITTDVDPAPVDTGTDVQAELERLRKALKETNKEAADRRKKLEAFEAAEKERQAAQMTELEKAQAQATEALKKAEEAEQARTATEAKALERLMRAEVISAASQLGFNDPADAWNFIDRTKITVTDEDTFEGIDKALEAVVKSKPYLVKADKAASGGTPTRKPRIQQQPESAPAPARRIVTL
jgi:hypothetical protein